jgi:hypothetical protein
MANIKFYPEGLDLFTLSAVTSEATGYEKEFMLDRRLATYWKATTGAAQNIDIDMGAADYAVDYVLLYGDFDIDDEITLGYDDNDSYSSPTGIGGTTTIIVAGWQWVWILFSKVSSADRYWRITITPDAAAPSAAVIFIGSVREITCRYNKNQIEGEYDYSGVQLSESLGGQRGVPIAHESRRVWEFFYETLDNTNKDLLDTILSLTEGRRYPICFYDTDGNPFYVRIMNDRLGMRQVEYQLYNSDPIILSEDLNA